MFNLYDEISSTLKQNKMRTALTGFAVTWGIIIIIVLLGTGNGLMNALIGNAEEEVRHLITIFPGVTSKPYKGIGEGTRVGLSDADMEYFGKYSDKIDAVHGSINYSETISLQGESLSCTMENTYPEIKERDHIPMLAGRFINDLDMEQTRKSIVLDDQAASMLLSGDEDCAKLVGRYVNVGRIPFQVVGIYETNRNKWGHVAYLPYTTVKKIRANSTWVDQVTLEFHGLETVDENREFQEELRESFNSKRGYDPTDTRTLYLWNQYSDQKQTVKAMGDVRTALWILGFLTLLSGIVGVSNIMLITVKERTKEFGIRKALGAKPLSVLGLVVSESVVITAIFGFVGIVLGMLANIWLDFKLASNPVDIGVTQLYVFKNIGVGFDVAIKATLLLIVSGTVAGIIPAWKGARVRPIEALRADK